MSDQSLASEHGESGGPQAPRCWFGQRHKWLTRGAVVEDHKVYLCTACGLVRGTDRKASLAGEGALFRAEEIMKDLAHGSM